AGEVLRDELCQEVLQLRRLALRLVGQVVVPNRLGAADVVNPDDERLEMLVLRLGPEVERQQADGDQRDAQKGDLEVRIHHQRGAEQLNVLALGVLDRRQLIWSRVMHDGASPSPPTEEVVDADDGPTGEADDGNGRQGPA